MCIRDRVTAVLHYATIFCPLSNRIEFKIDWEYSRKKRVRRVWHSLLKPLPWQIVTKPYTWQSITKSLPAEMGTQVMGLAVNLDLSHTGNLIQVTQTRLVTWNPATSSLFFWEEKLVFNRESDLGLGTKDSDLGLGSKDLPTYLFAWFQKDSQKGTILLPLGGDASGWEHQPKRPSCDLTRYSILWG